MRGLIRWTLFLAAVVFAATARADCPADASGEALQACLAQDLRDSDKRINAIYKLLMASLDEVDQTTLRDEQRLWLRRRDKACALSNKETDRDKWLQAILASDEKTLCVIRHTFSRVGQLEQAFKRNAPDKALDAPAAPSAPQFSESAKATRAPANLGFFDDGYKARTANTHERGKWYFEVWVDRGRIAELGDMLITAGVFSAKLNTIQMLNVRRTHVGQPAVLIGLAVNLDDGLIYPRYNGQWKLAPGLAGGPMLPLNTAYSAGVDASSEVRELFQRGLISVNLGEQPFVHPLPANYRAWVEN